MKEVIIDGIVYVPKEKSELELLKEKYDSGDYICIGFGEFTRIIENCSFNNPKTSYRLIHKKHSYILDAWLKDNSVEIEWFNVDGFCKCKYFIDSYNENYNYRLKQQYPIFRRNKNGEVFKIADTAPKGFNVTCMLSDSLNRIGYLDGEQFIDDTYKTIPYDSERGLYHLQPVWCWNRGMVSDRRIGFYNSKDDCFISEDLVFSLDFIEPITPEQLKTMPFIWDIYKEVLKSNR